MSLSQELTDKQKTKIREGSYLMAVTDKGNWRAHDVSTGKIAEGGSPRQAIEHLTNPSNPLKETREEAAKEIVEKSDYDDVYLDFAPDEEDEDPGWPGMGV
jgi:hypothetical protein